MVPYENTDGTPLLIATDCFGNERDAANPFPGAIEITKAGKPEFKVWPK